MMMANAFVCEICDKNFGFKRNLFRHRKNVHGIERERKKGKVKKCSYCSKSFTRNHNRTEHEACQHPEHVLARQNDEETICEVCQVKFKKRFFFSHQRSNVHLEKLLVSVDERVKVHESAFGKKCLTFQLKPETEDEKLDMELFLTSSKKIFIPLIETELVKRSSIKFCFTLVSVYHREADDVIEAEEAIKHFNSTYRAITAGTVDELSSDYDETVAEIVAGADEFQHHASGWSILVNVFILLNILTTQLKGGSSYIPRRTSWLLNVLY